MTITETSTPVTNERDRAFAMLTVLTELAERLPDMGIVHLGVNPNTFGLINIHLHPAEAMILGHEWGYTPDKPILLASGKVYVRYHGVRHGIQVEIVGIAEPASAVRDQVKAELAGQVHTELVPS